MAPALRSRQEPRSERRASKAYNFGLNYFAVETAVQRISPRCRFTIVDNIVDWHVTGARGCAFGDFDNDGLIDVLVNPINAAPQLLHCASRTGNSWITIKLIGSKSNRSAIGARVHCMTGDHLQIEEVRSGGSFYSQNDLRIHFGLGKATRIDKLEIHWPSHQIDQFTNILANHSTTAADPSSRVKLPGQTDPSCL